MVPLPRSLLAVPIAHRGYHDLEAGRPENSRSAFEAALDAGYGIEFDVQQSADGQAMVFHDYDLARLAHASGPIRQRSAEELSHIRLRGNDETIPTLREVLALVAGRVPLLIEVKEQDGVMGRDVGVLERDIADALAGYSGDVAVMSFNPNAVAVFRDALPEVPRGLTTSPFSAEAWPLLPESVRADLRAIPDFERVGASFISHQAADLSSARVAELKEKGVPVLCWTIHSPAEELRARRVADNITFEGYAPDIPRSERLSRAS